VIELVVDEDALVGASSAVSPAPIAARPITTIQADRSATGVCDVVRFDRVQAPSGRQ
jgi:hypothetical protein